jgi:LAS superfamily LD-carboxypeptidase LdcB
MHAADALPSVTADAVMEEEPLPIFSDHAISREILDAEFRAVRRIQMPAGCKVAPLDEIEDPDALTFENNAESVPADVEGLLPDAAQALDIFREMVTSSGGTFELKSAYRPPAYQAHLHDVWVKWMKELRNNRTAGCQALREEVGAEFRRHQLLARQQPVPASDHALGLAFDAAVTMPRAARLNRKRVTVDKLATLAGIRRPNSRRDPVHFTLLPQHLAAGD